MLPEVIVARFVCCIHDGPAVLQYILYSECFVVSNTRVTKISVALETQSWFDGASRLVKLRACSIGKALQLAAEGNEAASEMLEHVFSPTSAENPDAALLARLVMDSRDCEVVTVVSFVKPWDRAKFLVHLCKSLGSYNTEADLFLRSDIKQAMVRGRTAGEPCQWNYVRTKL
jgi:hypothetical protein